MLAFVFFGHLVLRFAMAKHGVSRDWSLLAQVEDFLICPTQTASKAPPEGLISRTLSRHQRGLIEAGEDPAAYQRILRKILRQESSEQQAAGRSIKLQAFNGAVISAIVFLLLTANQVLNPQPELPMVKYTMVACAGQCLWFWLFIRLRPRSRLREILTRGQLFDLIEASFRICAEMPNSLGVLRQIELEEMNSGICQRQKKFDTIKRLNGLNHNQARIKRMWWQSTSPIFELVGLGIAGMPIITIV